MSVELKLLPSDEETLEVETTEASTESVPEKTTAKQEKRRTHWRKRMISIERGLKLGFRGDTTFFAHFFVGSILVATSLVLGFSFTHWAIFCVAVTLILSAEMFNQVMRMVWRQLGHHLGSRGRDLLDLSHAAVFVSMVGGSIVILLLYLERIQTVFLD